MNWIKPNERKPEINQQVLVTTLTDSKKNIVHEAVYIGLNKLNLSVWHCPAEKDELETLWEPEVLAWCPMPEPYIKANSENVEES